MSEHTITAAICTRQRASVVAGALESLVGQEVQELSRVEVLVVDNGSTDGTADVARSFQGRLPFALRVIVEPQTGLSYARNTAVREASGSIIAFLDDDATASTEWLAGHLEAYQSDSEVRAVMGRIFPKWETPRPDWLDPLLEMYLTIADLGDEPFVLEYPNQSPIGANMSFLRQTLIDVGMFDPRFGFGGLMQIPYEETELAGRMHKENMKMVYWPRAAVWHAVPANRANLRWFTRRVFSQGRAELLYDLSHCPRNDVYRKLLRNALMRGPILAGAAALDLLLGRKARAARRASVSVYAAGYLKEFLATVSARKTIEVAQ